MRLIILGKGNAIISLFHMNGWIDGLEKIYINKKKTKKKAGGETGGLREEVSHILWVKKMHPIHVTSKGL